MTRQPRRVDGRRVDAIVAPVVVAVILLMVVAQFAVLSALAPAGAQDVVPEPGESAPAGLASDCHAFDGADVVDLDDRDVDGELDGLGAGVRVGSESGTVRAVLATSGTASPPLAAAHEGLGALTFDLDGPVGWVGLHVGRRDAGPEGTATITARDDEGTVVATTTASLPPGPAPVTTCVTVGDGTTFTRLDVELTAAGDDLDELVDRIVVAPGPPPATDAVAVELQDLGGRVEVPSDTPIAVVATITAGTDDLDVTMWQSWTDPEAPGVEQVHQIGAAALVRTPDAVVAWTRGRLKDGPGRVGVVVRTPTGAVATASQEVEVVRPAGATVDADAPADPRSDVRIGHVEVSQGGGGASVDVQNTGTSQRVLLDETFLAGLPTVVRVRLEGDRAVPGAGAQLVGIRAGRTLVGSPVPADRGDVVVGDDDPADDDLTFEVPAAWLDEPGELLLAVQVLPPLAATTCESCRADDVVHVEVPLAAPAAAPMFWLRPATTTDDGASAGDGTGATDPVDAAVLAEVLRSIASVLPVALEDVALAAPSVARAGQPTSVADAVVLTALTDLATGRDATVVEVTAPGVCDSRALLGAGWALTGACGTLPAHAVAHTLGAATGDDDHWSGEGCGALDGVALERVANRWAIVDPARPWRAVEGDVVDFDLACRDPHAHDVMSHGGRTQATGAQTWATVLDGLGTPTPLLVADDGAGTREDRLLVVTERDRRLVELARPARLGADDADVDVVVDGTRVPGIEIRDEVGTAAVVAVVPAAAESIEVGSPGIGDVPVRLRGVLTVTMTAPEPGATVDGPVRVTWRAPSTEVGTAMVEASTDGVTWWPVGFTTDEELFLDRLPVSGAVRLRVQVALAGRVGVSPEVEVSVAPVGPEVLVVAPTPDSHHASDDVVELVAVTTTDVDDADLVWEVDGQEVARGRQAVATGLGDGAHEVALRAVDRSAPGARMAVPIVVGDDRDGDGVPDAWEVEAGFDPLDPHDLMGDRDGDGLLDAREFTAGTSPTQVDTDADGVADGIEAAAGTDGTDPDDVPTSIHHWPSPLPTGIVTADMGVEDEDASWWGLRGILAVAVGVVVLVDIALIVRRRRAR